MLELILKTFHHFVLAMEVSSSEFLVEVMKEEVFSSGFFLEVMEEVSSSGFLMEVMEEVFSSGFFLEVMEDVFSSRVFLEVMEELFSSGVFLEVMEEVFFLGFFMEVMMEGISSSEFRMEETKEDSLLSFGGVGGRSWRLGRVDTSSTLGAFFSGIGMEVLMEG